MKPIDYQKLGYVVRNASMIRARLRYLEEATLGEVDEANQEVDKLNQELEALRLKLAERDSLLANLASLSHDFRTPLQVVVGFSELLLGTHLSPEQMEWTESIRRSGGDILSLVHDFLKLQTSPDLSMTAPSAVVDMKRLLESQVQMSRVLVGDKAIKLSFDYASEAPAIVLVPEVLLRRVVQNLLTNAIKFTTSGEVRLKVEGRQVGQNAHLMISVLDSGPGLHSELQERLFDRGVRGTQEDAGYGLGLSVCREIVEGLGGKIGADNLPESGARFWFKLKLPVVEEKPSVVTLPVEEASTPRPKILVADDDVMAQKLVRRLLGQMGFGVELVGNGHDALLAMMNQDFEAVIMDCDMPVMDGF
jgi:signal transduction histidine kinase